MTIETTIGKTVSIANATELAAALSKAQGGETFLLKGGNYGSLELNAASQPNLRFSSTVTIRSADMDNPAKFTGIRGIYVENIAFDGIKADYDVRPGDTFYVRPFYIRESANVSFSNTEFTGDFSTSTTDGTLGFRMGTGLTVANSTHIKVENSQFADWDQGMSLRGTSDVTIRGNEITRIGTDGVVNFEVTGALIEDNFFHNFIKNGESGSHRDMIQVLTSYSGPHEVSPSSDMTIRNNVFDSEGGDWTQTIWMRNEQVDSGAAGIEMYYRNIVIEGNVIRNAHVHGIYVGESIGTIIRDNTVIANADNGAPANTAYPAIRLSERSIGGLVEGNIAHAIIADPTTATVRDNLVIQRQSARDPNYYENVFLNALADSDGDVSDLRLLPGTAYDDYGSPLSKFVLPAGAALDGFVLSDARDGLERLTKDFSLRLFDSTGEIDASRYVVTWSFGDGAVATGDTAFHSFDKAGRYDVTAKVVNADGRSTTFEKSVLVETPLVLHATFDGATKDTSDLSLKTTNIGGVRFEAGEDGQALRLNGGIVRYARSPEFLSNDAYTLLVSVKSDHSATAGFEQLIDFLGGFSIALSATTLRAAAQTSKGGVVLATSDIDFTDGAWHDIALSFSGEDGTLSLYVDGVALARADGLEGAIQTGTTTHDFILGTAYAPNRYAGLIDNLAFVTGSLSADQIKAVSDGVDIRDILDVEHAAAPSAPTPAPEPAPAPAPTPAPEAPPPAQDQAPAPTSPASPYDVVLFTNFDKDASDIDAEHVTLNGGAILQTSDLGKSVSLERGYVSFDRDAEQIGNDAFTFTMSFRRDAGVETGIEEMASFNGSFAIYSSDDTIKTLVATDKGNYWMQAQGLELDDGRWHDLALRFSGADGAATVYLDGVKLSEVTGLDNHVQKGLSSQTITLGSAFNPNKFSGQLDDVAFIADGMSESDIRSLAAADDVGAFLVGDGWL